VPSVADVTACFSGVRRLRDGSAMALCPVHHDRNPSLHVFEGNNGWVKLHCFAGCREQDVLAAVGIRRVELGPELSPLWRGVSRMAQRETCYDYLGLDGELRYQSVRIDLSGGGQHRKTFQQRRPNPDYRQDQGEGPLNQRWLYVLDGVERVPYRWPELAASGRRLVFVVEGEGKADLLASWHLVATTHAGGASAAWPDRLVRILSRRQVVLLPDNDDPGRACMERLAGLLVRQGGGSLRWLELPGLPDKGDVVDWARQGGTPLRLRLLVGGCRCWR